MQTVPEWVRNRAEAYAVDRVGRDYYDKNYELAGYAEQHTASTSEFDFRLTGYVVTFSYRPLKRLGVEAALPVTVSTDQTKEPVGFIALVDNSGRIIEPSVTREQALSIVETHNVPNFDRAKVHVSFLPPFGSDSESRWLWRVTVDQSWKDGCSTVIDASVDAISGRFEQTEQKPGFCATGSF